jgi:hypothetical protein
VQKLPHKNPSQPGLGAQLNTTNTTSKHSTRGAYSFFLAQQATPPSKEPLDIPFLGKFCTRISSGHDWHHDNLLFVGLPCAHLPQQVVCLIFTFLGLFLAKRLK